MLKFRIGISLNFWKRGDYSGAAVSFWEQDGNFEELFDYVPIYRHEIKKIVWLLYQLEKKFPVKLITYKNKLSGISVPDKQTLLKFIQSLEEEYKKIKKPIYKAGIVSRGGSQWAEVILSEERYKQTGIKFYISPKVFNELKNRPGMSFFKYSNKADAYLFPKDFKTQEEAKKFIEELLK